MIRIHLTHWRKLCIYVFHNYLFIPHDSEDRCCFERPVFILLEVAAVIPFALLHSRLNRAAQSEGENIQTNEEGIIKADHQIRVYSKPVTQNKRVSDQLENNGMSDLKVREYE